MTALPLFRVHIEDGRTFDVRCEHPDDAREAAMMHFGRVVIAKVKRVKEGSINEQ